MTDQEGTTRQLQGLIDRMRGGDVSARDELIVDSVRRLRTLAHRILDRFPGARARLAETDDVAQEAAIRLAEALKTVPVTSVGGFFGLAGKKMRELLIDMTRKRLPPVAMGAGAGTTRARAFDPTAGDDGPVTLGEWTEFHRTIESMPQQEREVFDLIFYGNLTQAEAAEVLGVSVRTIKRRWQDARILLYELYGDEMPGH